MANHPTRQQLILRETGEEYGREERLNDPIEGINVFEELAASQEFVPDTYEPLRPGEPEYCPDCCTCGCRRLPADDVAGFCIHCGHLYRKSTNYWFWQNQDFHCSHCYHFQEYAHPGSRTLPASCGALAPSASPEQAEGLDEAIHRLYRVVYAVNNYLLWDDSDRKGEGIESLRQQALEFLSAYAQKA